MKQKWIDTVLKNYKEKNKNYSHSDVEHILDWLENTDEKITIRISFQQALEKANKWVEKINKLNEEGITGPGVVEVMMSFDKGYKVVLLNDEMSYKWEGYHMGHCVASYFGRDAKIYSLRDSNNIPHCTIEFRHRYISQIKGRGNGAIKPSLISYVIKFVESIDCTINEYELKNLGYLKFNPSEVSTLKTCFKGVKTINFNNHEFVYKHNSVKRIKDYTQAKNLIAFFINKNNIEEIKYIIDKGFDIHMDDEYIFRQLCKNVGLGKIKKERFELIKFLVEENNVDLSAISEEALTSAVYRGSLELVEYLVDKGASLKYINGLLQTSINYGHLDIANYLIEKGIESSDNFYDAFVAAVRRGDAYLHIIKYFVSKGVDIHQYNESALKICAKSGHVEVLKFLVECGANFKIDENHPFRTAAKHGYGEIMDYLIEKGADVHAKNEFAFRYAIKRHEYELARFLLENYDVNIHAEDDFALIEAVSNNIEAVSNNNFEFIKFLIENGANIHARNEFALRHAVYNSNIELMKYIMNAGSDISMIKEINDNNVPCPKEDDDDTDSNDYGYGEVGEEVCCESESNEYVIEIEG